MTDTLTYTPLQVSQNGHDVLSEKEENIYIPDLVANKNKFSTLYVTDMPFNSNTALANELPFIGYGGLTDQYSENLSSLHPRLTELIAKKKVHSIVLLFNSDITDPGFRVGSEEDLTKPLYKVYGAVQKFRDLLHEFDPNVTLWFTHIKHRFMLNKTITLDDLFADEDDEAVFNAIKKYKNKENAFLERINLTEFSMNRLYNHLKLKDVLSFYSYFSDQIKYYEFVFKSVKYCHDGEKLEKIQYSDAKLYLRVGPDYYKRVMLLNAHDDYEETMKRWKKGEITSDYGADFMKQIPKYDAFINRPCNTGEYQRIYTTNHNGIVSTLFNMYNPVDHEPKAGEWPHIKKFLRHIFSACNLDGEILFEFGLDYLQLSYLKPTQRLPTLCLVSSERNTGKSTFLNFLNMMFGSNVTILDNQRFDPKFTTHFAGKLFVAIDEGHIPVNDKTTKEMIKNMATGKVMWLEGKGTNAESVENFTHLIFCSNDEKNFMQIDAGENRFAVLKVPTLKKPGSKDDPELLEKMQKEIPAFLNFLQNRKLHYNTNATRFWFAEHIYTTEALQVIIDRTKDTLETELIEFFTDMFLDTKQVELNYTLKDLHLLLNENTSLKLPKNKLGDILLDKYAISPGPSKRYKLFTVDNNGEPLEQGKKGRYCTFHAKDWLSEENYLELTKNEEN